MATTGLPAAMASMITIGSPSAKLGITRACARAISSRTPVSATQPVMVTREAQVARKDPRLDLAPHRAVPDQRQSEIGAVRDRLGEGVDQEQLPFLLDKPSDRDEDASLPSAAARTIGKRAGSMPQCTTWMRCQTP